MTAMRTWRDEQGTPDTTQWLYDQATGLLTNKLYADGKGPSYTYTADGKLATRVWERGISTTYGYDTLGQLTSVAYSDATPSVTNTYDRLGRQVSSEGRAGSPSTPLHTTLFAYDPDTLALTNETIIANGATNVITREHDARGRNSGFALTHPQTPTPPYSVTYGYDTYGRFNAVSSSVFSAFSVANYSHLPNADLLSGYTITGTGDVLEVSRTYEDHRNLITAVEHEVDSTLISRYAYANNEIGHRTHVVNQGSAFADVGDAMNFYGYNTRGEVTRLRKAYGGHAKAVRRCQEPRLASKKPSRGDNNPNNPGATVAGQTFGYDYDPIGNRTWSKRGDHSREYEANELNQYTSRDAPDVAHLLRLREEATAGQVGSADTNATVTVNSQSVTRQNAYWYKDLAVTNDTDPQYPEVVIDATWSNLFSSVTGNVFVAETPEDFGYDDDGNMTNDGRFAYTWDGDPTPPRLRRARNRLVAVETLTNVVAASGAPQVRVEYAYDHKSRRIGKTVYSDFTTNSAYATTNQTAYIYDGWNLVRSTTLSDDGVATNCFVWGLDLSGSLQGAGGIGGLLAMIEGRAGSPSTPLFYTYDANGNVGQLLEAANPTNILAHYAYSPFGETLVAVGDLAKANPFRFSTKYHEDESGLVYYGYRYYSPVLGRWINRDPIGERGGVNVYGFVGNQAVSKTDLLGLIGGMPSSPSWGGSGQNSIAIGPGNQVLGMQIQGMCGQIDVTVAVNNVLDSVADVYENDWDTCEKRARCKALYHPWYAIGAWDIHPLAGMGLYSAWPFGPNFQAGTDYGCENTVVYAGKCYRAGALNYVMWGKANSLCRDTFTWNPIHTLTASRTLVFAWKTVYLWAQVGEAKAFTTYGYNGGEAPDCDLPNCFVGSDISESPTDFTYDWNRVN